MIEDFESYTTVLDVYYKWQTSTANKDEQIERFTDTTIGLKNHVAKMYYKTDLPEAEYRVNFESVEGYTAIEFLAKDVPHGSYGGVLTVYLYGGPNELYSYKIKKNNFDDEWTRYIIPISAFELTENSFGSQHIVCDSITGISFGFSASTATLLKTKLDYDSGSYACIDNIRFTNASEFSKQEVSGKITMSGSKAMISDFESDDTFVFWDVKDDAPFAANEVAPNAACVIKADESASGTGRSLQLSYKTQMVAPFSTYFVVDDSVSAKGLTLLLKGDGRAPYIEIVVYVGNKGYKKRIDVADGWNYYSIGFSEFKYNNTAESLSASSVTDVSQIAFYIKNYSGNYIASNLYLDEIYFDNSITVSTNSVVAYSA